MKKLIFIILGLLMFSTLALAQTTHTVQASWVAPVEGSPVVSYVLELSIDGGPFTLSGTSTTTSLLLELNYNTIYIARVAGIDALDRQGVWSLNSEPYSDFGAPGPPGMPIIVLEI